MSSYTLGVSTVIISSSNTTTVSASTPAQMQIPTREKSKIRAEDYHSLLDYIQAKREEDKPEIISSRNQRRLARKRK